MTTPVTTWETLRDFYEGLIKDLIPTKLPDIKFSLSPDDEEITEWAEDHPGAALRRFSISDTSIKDAPPVDNQEITEELGDSLLVEIAYPHKFNLYGSRGMREMDAVVNSDAHQIKRTIELLAPQPTGLHNAIVETAISDGDALTFLEISIGLHYYRSNTA